MEILLVILDLDPGRWDSTAHLLNASKALLTFLSLYLAQNQSISVHLYLAHHGKADLAWSEPMRTLARPVRRARAVARRRARGSR